MKALIAIIAGLVFILGCAQAPVIAPVVIPGPVSILAPGCVQSKTAAHSYQSEIDPKVISDTWTEVPRLRKGDSMFMKVSYRNPNHDTNIPVALLVMQRRRVTGYILLVSGVPKLYVRDAKTDCFQGQEIAKGYFDRFLADLYAILNGKRI